MTLLKKKKRLIIIIIIIIMVRRRRRRRNVRFTLPYKSATLSILVDILDSCSVISIYVLFVQGTL
jgi:hypothetical protein